jgi:Ser/Thr protein kinase RdoA (MazF antagonist)
MMAKAAATHPEQASQLLDLLQSIRKLAPSETAEPLLTPTHGQYTPANVFLQANEVTVIDLDRICLSDPAKDVAMFVHRVKSMLYKKASGDTVKSEYLSNIFVREYQSRAEGNLANLAYYRALYLLKGFAKFAKDYAPADPARRPLEEFYLGEFERCLKEGLQEAEK